MKITLNFKTPDIIDYALDELDLLRENLTWEQEDLKHKVKDKLKKWIKYGESISIKFDLDQMTAIVLEK